MTARGFAKPTSDLKPTSRTDSRSKKRLRLKEKHGGEVVAISMGPERAKQTIKEALAKGAERGIHISDPDFYKLDPLTSARSLAAAIQSENFDLILTGLQSDDQGFGQTGVLLAELLGRPHATIIMAIEVTGDTHEAEARARGRMVSVGRAAAAGCDHDSIGNQQAALRHAQGHHGRQEERDRDGRARRRWASRMRARSRSSASTSRRKRRRRSSSRVRRKRPRRS